MDQLKALRALSNEKRLLVMEWLKAPAAHFPPQVDGDLVKDGVCGQFIADKLGVTAATASVHLRQLVDAGLLQQKKIKQWTFYKRDERRLRELKRELNRGL
jgi:DNA-binding transcriptional ArsR family regulator